LGLDFIEVLWDGLHDRVDASGLATAVDAEKDGEFPRLSERGPERPPEDLPIAALAASDRADQP
jgi:hypothetical protein